jgi:hypothetical protein
MNQTESDATARLSGFLFAVAAFSGEIRDYEGSCYAIDVREEGRSIGDIINEHFHGQFKFSFRSATQLEIEFKELETKIGQYLIRDKSCVIVGRILTLQNYLSFRVMDMIDDVFHSYGKRSNLRVFEIHDEINTPFESSTFFCIRSLSLALILQFNNNRNRQ